MKSSCFDYFLPRDYIAQHPLEKRDESRLLIVDRKRGVFKETLFKDIVNILLPSDCIVLNNTKVLPARIFGRKETGARIEFLFIKEYDEGLWEVLVRPQKRLRENTVVFLPDNIKLKAVRKIVGGRWLVKFFSSSVKSVLKLYGEMPTPPYIKEELKDKRRYQTVYAKKEGAIAAPTAGLHFTKKIISMLKKKGVTVAYLTLHVGLGTFRPIKANNIEDHKMEEEEFSISRKYATIINEAKKERRIIAVGTTVTRALESAAKIIDKGCYIEAGKRKTDLFIQPGYNFKIIDGLLTNFHLPLSTNLVLVSAFGGIELVRKVYAYAIKKKFRFYSFGDVMLIL